MLEDKELLIIQQVQEIPEDLLLVATMEEELVMVQTVMEIIVGPVVEAEVLTSHFHLVYYHHLIVIEEIY